ncbi:hypothetical protein ABUK73_14235 [Agrobacterium sp. BA1120]
MKAVFKRIRFSRKFVLIGSGILLLGGASGVAAIVVGKERLFGPTYASVNGLECKMVQTVNIRKNGAVWIRKFIRTDGGDGTERVKTALRVAKAVYDKQKPDLVQVSVLDEHGPTMRSDMRGRAIAAQVVFIPDVKKLPEDADAKTYSAFYYDGVPNGDGLFYGLRIDLPLEDTEQLSASLKDFTDCSDPAAEAPADAHGSAAKGHEKSGGHGESGGHGDSGGHGEAAPAEAEHGSPAPEAAHDGGHNGEPSAEGGHSAPDDPQLLTSTPEHDSGSIFSFAYIKSLIFGKGSTVAVAAEPAHEAPADAPPAHTPAVTEPAEAAKPEH